MMRLFEKIRQKQGVGVAHNKEWTPTSNGRNEAMLKDVRAFAQHLKTTRKEIDHLSASVNSSMLAFRTVLLSPLPRAYNEMPGGVIAIDREAHLIGLNVTPEALAIANQEVQRRLHQDVVVPLEQWLATYRETKEFYRRSESERLELDNKRRVVFALQEKYQHIALRRGDRSRPAQHAMHKVVTEEDKLTRLAQRYAESEAQVFNAFLLLIRDSAMLREFIASTLAFLQSCYASAYHAFEIAPAPPMPVLPAHASVPLLEYTPADINVSKRLMATPAAAAASPTALTGIASSPRVHPIGSPRIAGSTGPTELGSSYGTPALLTNGSMSHNNIQAPPSPNAQHASENNTFYPGQPSPNDTMTDDGNVTHGAAPYPTPHPGPMKQAQAPSATGLVRTTSREGVADAPAGPYIDYQHMPPAPTHQVNLAPYNQVEQRQAMPA